MYLYVYKLVYLLVFKIYFHRYCLCSTSVLEKCIGQGDRFYSGLSPLLFNLKEVKLVLKFFPYRMKGLNLCPLHVKQIILFWDSFFHLSVSKTDRGNYLHGVSFGWGERINDKNNKPYSILESSPS